MTPYTYLTQNGFIDQQEPINGTILKNEKYMLVIGIETGPPHAPAAYNIHKYSANSSYEDPNIPLLEKLTLSVADPAWLTILKIFVK